MLKPKWEGAYSRKHYLLFPPGAPPKIARPPGIYNPRPSAVPALGFLVIGVLTLSQESRVKRHNIHLLHLLSFVSTTAPTLLYSTSPYMQAVVRLFQENVYEVLVHMKGM